MNQNLEQTKNSQNRTFFKQTHFPFPFCSTSFPCELILSDSYSCCHHYYYYYSLPSDHSVAYPSLHPIISTPVGLPFLPVLHCSVHTRSSPSPPSPPRLDSPSAWHSSPIYPSFSPFFLSSYVGSCTRSCARSSATT